MIFFYDLINQLKFIWITQPLAMLIITSYNWTTGGFVFFSFSCLSYLREKTNKIYILRPEIRKKKLLITFKCQSGGKWLPGEKL